MKTLSVVTPPSSVISAGFIIEHKDFPLSIVTPVYNHHFFRICIVPKWCDYKQGSTVDCVSHIVEVVKKSSSAGLNKAQCYENGEGFQYLDLNSVLNIFFKKLNGLQKYPTLLF